MRTGSAARTRLMLKPRADVARAGRFRLHRGLAATIMPAMRPSRLAIAASLLLLLVSLTVAGTWLWGRHALETCIARWRAEQIERGYTIDYRGPAFGGFPFALSVGFEAPRVTTPPDRKSTPLNSSQ